MISIDAIFGLPRKKSAGRSFRPPLHGTLFFENQDEVDRFVEANPVSNKQDKVLMIILEVLCNLCMYRIAVTF